MFKLVAFCVILVAVGAEKTQEYFERKYNHLEKLSQNDTVVKEYFNLIECARTTMNWNKTEMFIRAANQPHITDDEIIDYTNLICPKVNSLIECASVYLNEMKHLNLSEDDLKLFHGAEKDFPIVKELVILTCADNGQMIKDLIADNAKECVRGNIRTINLCIYGSKYIEKEGYEVQYSMFGNPVNCDLLKDGQLCVVNAITKTCRPRILDSFKLMSDKALELLKCSNFDDTDNQ